MGSVYSLFVYPREGEWPSDLIIPVRRQPRPALKMLQASRILSDLQRHIPDATGGDQLGGKHYVILLLESRTTGED